VALKHHFNLFFFYVKIFHCLFVQVGPLEQLAAPEMSQSVKGNWLPEI